MRVVVDANILSAGLIRPAGWTGRQLRRTDVTWVALETLLEELAEHVQEVAERAGVPQRVLQGLLEGLADRIGLVPHQDLVDAASSPAVARALEVDPRDAFYLAALEVADAALLWTRDGGLLEAFPGVAVRVVPGAERGG